MAGEMADELGFEQSMGKMSDRKLIEFVARQTLEITGKCANYDRQISALENGDRKASGIIGGISGTVTAGIIGVINYFFNRN